MQCFLHTPGAAGALDRRDGEGAESESEGEGGMYEDSRDFCQWERDGVRHDAFEDYDQVGRTKGFRVLGFRVLGF